jgi:hypothetical protein
LIYPQGCSFVLISNRETKATLTRFYMASGFLCNSILRSQGTRFATFYVAGILLLVLCRGDRENFAQTPASVCRRIEFQNAVETAGINGDHVLSRAGCAIGQTCAASN